MTWRERFNMSGPPLPRDAAGETFFDQGPHFQRLARVFAWLTAEPGIGVVTGEPGVGKTYMFARPRGRVEGSARQDLRQEA